MDQNQTVNRARCTVIVGGLAALGCAAVAGAFA